MAKSALALAGLILSSMFAASYCSRTAEAGKVLAVTVNGINCADAKAGGSHARRTQTAGSAYTCALHGCTADSDQPCQLQPINHMTFAPCAGAVLISTADILQSTADPAEAFESSSSAPLPPVLQLAAACSSSNTHASSDSSNSTAATWTNTFSLSLSPGDWKSTAHADPSGSSVDLGQQQHSQPALLDAHPATASSAQSLRDGWTAGDLLLVDLVIPTAPADPSVQQLTSSGTATAEQDRLDAGVCTAGWSLWLARAGMAVFLIGLQLLPLSSRLYPQK
jgi:hypothetical protein